MHPTLAATLLGLTLASPAATQDPSGFWRAWLESPGGELPFEMQVQLPTNDTTQPTATIFNDPESIEVPEVTFRDGKLVLVIDYYDSKIEADLNADGTRLHGAWTKRLGKDRWRRMVFHAERKAARGERFRKPDTQPVRPASFAGRWSVQFEKDAHPAVGIFVEHGARKLTGTFLTTLGDYRFLAGVRDGDTLRLSCFDGAHAFLFHASQTAAGELRGDFWSSDKWHETFRAKRDPKAALPDAWKLTKADANHLSAARFPDLDGRVRGLDDAELRGHPRLVVVFGSWCPNCKDETTYLVELDRRYRSKGLRIVGLAFELTGDPKRDRAQLQTYAKSHGIRYPILVGGISNKAKASQALPLLDRVRSYPTTIFIDREGKVHAVHTGFSGPGTGAEHARLRKRFEETIERMLEPAGPARIR